MWLYKKIPSNNFVCNGVLKGNATLIKKYISQRRPKQTVKKYTKLIKIGQEITKILLFEGFNMVDMGAAILNVLRDFKNF